VNDVSTVASARPVFYYVFDALPMLLAIWIFHVSHPGRYFADARKSGAHPDARHSGSTLGNRDVEMNAPKAQ
jgi:hypothetical protein